MGLFATKLENSQFRLTPDPPHIKEETEAQREDK